MKVEWDKLFTAVNKRAIDGGNVRYQNHKSGAKIAILGNITQTSVVKPTWRKKRAKALTKKKSQRKLQVGEEAGGKAEEEAEEMAD